MAGWRSIPLAGSKPASGALRASAIGALVALALFQSSALDAADMTDEEAVAAGKDGLAGRTRFPFYDRQKDDVRQLNVEPPAESADSANRRSKWTGKKAASRTRGGGGG